MVGCVHVTRLDMKMATGDRSVPDLDSCNALINRTTQKLRCLTRQSYQSGWHGSNEAGTIEQVLGAENWRTWAIAPLNAKGYIAWTRGKRPLWLCQQLVVPEALHGFSLAGLSLQLGLTWWAEAVDIYINGDLVQQGDLFDYFARIPLGDRVSPGDTFTLALYLLSPGHDDGALVRTEAIFESADPILPEPGFIADELTVLQTYAQTLAPEKLVEIAQAIAPLNWETVADRDAFQQELRAVRDRLLPLSQWIKQRRIGCVGHAHLDLAWLWPVEDTWHAAERTFQSVLALQQDFPELTYTHSSPALFEWLETHKPELFQQVQRAVAENRWSIDAGLWVEPELNVVGGESLARQILYGQQYVSSRFGHPSAIAWLPDSFGFSWQLPQLLKLGGVDYFATQKLRWNEATKFPHALFWWQGLDGTRLLSLTLPPIGTDVDPCQMAEHGATWEKATGLTEMLWLPGMGDHGGGPTRAMLQTAQRWAASPFFPQLAFTSPLAHLQRLTETIAEAPTPAPNSAPPPSAPSGDRAALPVWQDELYLELHRGCYTVHADQKWFNRRCEDALREAELFAAIAHNLGRFAYPRKPLEAAWKRVLFNQFHDILPGTAIPEVFETINPDWQTAYDTAKTIRSEALSAIAQRFSPGPLPHPQAIPLWVFNSLNWQHTAVVEVDLTALPTVSGWQVLDGQTQAAIATQISPYRDNGETPPCQPVADPTPTPRLLFTATVPPVGFRCYWLIPQDGPVSTPPDLPISAELVLENALLRAEVDAQSGDLVALWSKANQRNVLRSPANQLQAFADKGQYWDAWDIAPNYQEHPLPPATVRSMQWLEKGPLRQRLRVVREVAASVIQQDYVLDQGCPFLKIATVAEWQATQVVLKTAFPLSITAPEATYEIPFGAISRPTQSTDPHQQAKWEVPAYRWADLSNDGMGLSVLTDYKHGVDVKPNQLRLTLLKAPLWPDPQADRGRHHFTYALYPHGGDWRAGRTPQQAIALTTPLRPVVGAAAGSPKAATLVFQGSLIDLDGDGVHLAAVKLAEDSTDYILRFWELYGNGAPLNLKPLNPESVDLLERAIAQPFPHRLAPWQVATVKVSAILNKSLSHSLAATNPT